MTTEKDTVIEPQVDLRDSIVETPAVEETPPTEKDTLPSPESEDEVEGAKLTTVPEGDESKSKPEDEVTPKTYTEEEHTAGLKTAREETSVLQEELAAQALESDIQKRISEENSFAAQDAEAVAAEELTPQQATEKKEQRKQAYIQELQTQGDSARYNAAMTRANVVARATTAETLAKEYLGIDEVALFEDQSITTAAGMKLRARELHLDIREAALKKTAEDKEANKEGDEDFDSGISGSTGVVVTEGMTPFDASVVAYGPEETSRRNKNKNRS